MLWNGLKKRHLLGLLFCQLWLLGTTQAADDILPPEEAFPYEASADAERVTLQFEIPDGYYLYRERFSFGTQDPAVLLGDPDYPKGKIYEDEFFGAMEIYRGGLQISIPYVNDGGSDKFDLELRLQGCADIGICYPPQKWMRSVNLPADSQSNNPLSAFLSGKGSTPSSDPLPVEEAFELDFRVDGPNELAVSWRIAPGYYLYKDKFGVSTKSDEVQLGQPRLPEGKPKTDEYFGDTEVFFDFVEANVPFSRRAAGETPLALTVAFQGCKENGICYPPHTQEVSLLLPAAATFSERAAPPAAPVSEQDRLAQLIVNGSLTLVLVTFFGLGLLLAFTPCVLPMVPILSGIIAGQGESVSARRGFGLSFAYVMGMAITYTAAGALAAMAGEQIQAMFQKPWVITLFAGIFVALAMSMFGFYELQMPSAIQTRLANLSNKQQGGTVIGTVIMGALSALIVTTCVAPPLVATLAVIGQTGDVVRGASALFALSLGMGAPLLVVGASAGQLLPKVGPWMDAVKGAFGVMMLGLAVWMMERVLPGTITLALWAVLIFVTGVFMGALEPLPSPATAGKRLGKSVGLLACLYGALMLIGATLGGNDPLRPIPLANLASGGSIGGHQEAVAFERISTVADLDAALVAAKTDGKPVMLDFTAEWCVSCKEMEKYTFSEQAVADALSDYVLLQADVTDNNEADKALLARFNIFGPPTIAFFDGKGVEHNGLRLVGFVPPEEFIAHVERARSL